LGAYNKNENYHNNWTNVAKDTRVITSNSEGDFSRIIKILYSNNLIAYKGGVEPENPTPEDIDNSIKNLNFSNAWENGVDPKLLISTYDNETDNPLIFINGNFVLDSGEIEGLRNHVVGYESPENNPYNNLVAVKESNKDSDKSKELIKVLTSYVVGEYIAYTWPTELVIPAHLRV
jgi:D-methionine transport system substrate-binding protein